MFLKGQFYAIQGIYIESPPSYNVSKLSKQIYGETKLKGFTIVDKQKPEEAKNVKGDNCGGLR